MRRFVFIFLGVSFLLSVPLTSVHAQTDPPTPAASTSSRITAPPDPRMIDGVAARIEDDIITESEVRELSAFQLLVDGQSKPREEVIHELIDQWIVNGEANVAQFKSPPEDEVTHAFQQLVGKFSSPEEFRKRCAQSDLTEADVRRLITKEVYLSHFLDYRFRPAAQIGQKQIEAYYNNELVPKLKAQDQPVPALEDVEDAIQEVLVQRTISERSTEWLNETRTRLKIDVMSPGDQP
jgi:hypothetical protein